MRSHLVTWLDNFLPHSLAALLAPTWFTCVGAAGVLGVLWMLRNARRARLDIAPVASVVLWSYLAAVIAGIVVPMAIDTAEHLIGSGRFIVHWSGMTSFWGYLAGFAVVMALTRRHRLELGRFADLTAAPLGGALILCRLGCFLAGCDFGKVTAGPWALRFPAMSPAWHEHVRAGVLPPGRDASLPVHPTQLYEAGVGLAMIAVALLVSRTAWARARGGRTFLAVAATYGVGRIGVEMLRGDAGRGLWLGLSSGQLFSLALLAAVAIALLLQRRAMTTRTVLPHVAAVAIALFVLGRGGRALAWPMPQQPQPQPAAQPAQRPVQPAPTAQPGGPGAQPPSAPTGAPTPMPMPMPPPSDAAPISPYPEPPRSIQLLPPPVFVGAPARAPTGRPRYEVGLLLGWATPLNRRDGQVATLAGPSLSIGVALPSSLGAWLDFDSLGNDDASHGTLALSGGFMHAMNDRLELGGRIGLGFTLVNFDEPAFRDVTGTNVRFEALLNYSLDDRWQLWLRPISIEVLQHSDLGGPITTWQVRLGVAARFGTRMPSARPAGPPPPPPAMARTGSGGGSGGGGDSGGAGGS